MLTIPYCSVNTSAAAQPGSLDRWIKTWLPTLAPQPSEVLQGDCAYMRNIAQNYLLRDPSYAARLWVTAHQYELNLGN